MVRLAHHARAAARAVVGERTRGGGFFAAPACGRQAQNDKRGGWLPLDPRGVELYSKHRMRCDCGRLFAAWLQRARRLPATSGRAGVRLSDGRRGRLHVSMVDGSTGSL